MVYLNEHADYCSLHKAKELQYCPRYKISSLLHTNFCWKHLPSFRSLVLAGHSFDMEGGGK